MTLNPLSLVQQIAGVAALAILAALGIWIVILKGEVRHYRKAYDNEHAAFTTTVAGYRAAAAQAVQADAANRARVEAEQRAINERTVNDYEARIAAVRQRYADLLRGASHPANPGSPSSPSVPGSGTTPGGTAGPAPQDRLPESDALICTEQAIQLDALQAWVRGQARVDPENR